MRRYLRYGLVLLLGVSILVYWVGIGTILDYFRDPSLRGVYFNGEVPTVQTNRPRNERPNVVVISIDTLRWDRLFDPTEQQTLPSIEVLRKESAELTQVVSNTSWTMPSHASFFTGLLSHEHGAFREHVDAINPSTTSYVQFFRTAGYRTMAFTGGGYITKKRGFSRGFERYYEAKNPFEQRRYFRRTVDEAKDYLEKTDTVEPLFLFLHTYELHDYWHFYPNCVEKLRSEYEYLAESLPIGQSKPQPIDHWTNLTKKKLTGMEYLYNCGLENVDRPVGQAIDYLKANDLYEDSYVVFLSDHGEGFSLEPRVLEHGNIEPDNGQVQEQLTRVPVLVKFPEGKHAGRRFDTLLSIRDLLPLIAQSSGLEVPTRNRLEEYDGLENFLRTKSAGRKYVYGSIEDKHGPKLFVRGRDYKLTGTMKNGRYTFSAIDHRTGEERPVEESEIPPEKREEMSRRLKVFAREFQRGLANKTGRDVKLNEEDRKELEGLGYL